MTGVWIISGLTVIAICWLTIWVTNKAYSRKWEEDEPNPPTNDNDR